MLVGVAKGGPASLMEGRLKDHPLAELIHEISDARLSGALRLAFERVRAVVYFEAGRVVAAASNLRALRLTEVMLKGGVVNAQTLFSAAGEGASDDDAVTALVGSGMLDASALRRAREFQTLEVLRDAFRRQEGEWSFDPRARLAAERHVSVSVPPLLVEGARSLAHDVVARRLANDNERLTPEPDALERLEASALRLSPAEGFVMSRVYEPTNLRYVLAVSGLPEDETRHAVYALALGGLITRERWPRALPAFVPHQTTTRTAAPTPTPNAEPQQPAAAEPEVKEAAAQAPAEEDPHELIKELLELGRGETHYSVLGVTRSTAPSDIKRVYYSLARRLHPDRLRRVADADTQQRIDAAFAKIAQAYDVLKDAKLRASYDLKLEKRRPTPKESEATRTDSPRADAPARTEATHTDASATTGGAHAEQSMKDEAEQKFRQGLAAYARRDFAAARLLFGDAARIEPRQARFRAHLGHTLARDKSTRRQAETELLAAVSLDALDASFRVMLAELYKEVGMRRKAEAQLERALVLEPTNAEARALFAELKRSES